MEISWNIPSKTLTGYQYTIAQVIKTNGVNGQEDIQNKIIKQPTAIEKREDTVSQPVETCGEYEVKLTRNGKVEDKRNIRFPATGTYVHARHFDR